VEAGGGRCGTATHTGRWWHLVELRDESRASPPRWTDWAARAAQADWPSGPNAWKRIPSDLNRILDFCEGFGKLHKEI
jgi:hypothetical protein